MCGPEKVKARPTFFCSLEESWSRSSDHFAEYVGSLDLVRLELYTRQPLFVKWFRLGMPCRAGSAIAAKHEYRAKEAASCNGCRCAALVAVDSLRLLFVFHLLRFNASDFAVRVRAARAPAVRVPVALSQRPGSVAGFLDRSGTSGRFSDLSPVAFSFPPSAVSSGGSIPT